MTTRRNIIKAAIGATVAALLPWKRSSGMYQGRVESMTKSVSTWKIHDFQAQTISAQLQSQSGKSNVACGTWVTVEYEALGNPLPEGTHLFIDDEDVTQCAFWTKFEVGKPGNNGVVKHFSYLRNPDGSVIITDDGPDGLVPTKLSRIGHIELRKV